MTFIRKALVLVLLCQVLSNSSYANQDNKPEHCWCRRHPIVTAFILAGVIVAVSAPPICISIVPDINNKTTTLNNLIAESETIAARHTNATQFASAKRTQIAQEQQGIANLDCMLTQEPGFQEYVNQRCSAEIFSSITDPTAFLNDTYGLTFYSPSDYTTRSFENVYRTETYYVSQSYSCLRCAHWYGRDCLYYNTGTCGGTVARTRQVLDYQRTIDTIYTQAGTSIQGQSQRQTSCNPNLKLSLIANTEQTNNTWDRNDQTHYYNRISITTALNFLAMTRGATIQTGKGIIDKNSSLTQAGNRLIDFIRSQCQTVPQRLAWNQAETEANRTAHQILLTRYQSELPSLEAEQRLSQGMLSNISTQITDIRDELESSTNLLIGLLTGISGGLPIVVAVVGVCVGYYCTPQDKPMQPSVEMVATPP